MNRCSKVCAVLLLCIFFLFSCASNRNSSRPGFKRAPLFGMVYDYDGRPVAGVKITVDDIKGPLSDINGRFILSSIDYGRHSISFKKTGFEPVAITFDFLNKTQVLYIKTASLGQLITMGENYIKRREWQEAERTLKRASRINEDDPVLRYVRTILAYKLGNLEEAESALNTLLSEGHNEPYVHLLLADVYEFGFGDAETAAMHVKNFLTLKYDDDVAKRLKRLEEE